MNENWAPLCEIISVVCNNAMVHGLRNSWAWVLRSIATCGGTPCGSDGPPTEREKTAMSTKPWLNRLEIDRYQLRTFRLRSDLYYDRDEDTSSGCVTRYNSFNCCYYLPTYLCFLMVEMHSERRYLSMMKNSTRTDQMYSFFFFDPMHRIESVKCPLPAWQEQILQWQRYHLYRWLAWHHLRVR